MKLPQKSKKPQRLHASLPLISVLVLFSVIGYSFYKGISKPTSPKQAKVENTQPNEIQAIDLVKLPQPSIDSKYSLEKALKSRRSRRAFHDKALNLKQISQMLWSGQGITSDWGGRTAPSAKSAYPLTLYLVAFNVTDLKPGVYEYLPGDQKPLHQLLLRKPGELKEEMTKSVGQNSISTAPAAIVITGDFAKMSTAFGGKEVDSNVYLEVGHAAQNLYLQAESLGLGMVTVAGFNAENVQNTLGIKASNKVIYVAPFGYPKE